MRSILLIDHANLRRLDRGLLVAFDALLAEGSFTRAAERLGIGQPSMSLGRLSELFEDELFVRAPGGVRPMPRALALADRSGSRCAAAGSPRQRCARLVQGGREAGKSRDTPERARPSGGRTGVRGRRRLSLTAARPAVPAATHPAIPDDAERRSQGRRARARARDRPPRHMAIVCRPAAVPDRHRWWVWWGWWVRSGRFV